ncbi:MAG: chaperone modulatory protein CbpM [Nitrospirae bacterium]|nr:MAG: chaperone modulatory protein CbpM [Nitrospirota bacterium]
MAENHHEELIEYVTADWAPQQGIRLEELCARLGIGQDVLELCLQWEIIQPFETEPEGERLVPVEAIERLGRGLRLWRDLGLNWAGVSVVLDLLDRIEELERRLQERFEP